MTVLPIDLNDSVPGVIKQDMLLLDRTENRSRWNCISLSLVLNFAPDNKDRGLYLHVIQPLYRLFPQEECSCYLMSF
jgi:25S rRNA (adenine2142-N1)-methyltransferase